MYMHLRIRYNHRLPTLVGVKGGVYYPYILFAVSEEEARKQRYLHHEWVHILQIRRDGVLTFYLRWLGSLIKNLIRDKNFDTAYRNIPYEKEAYTKMDVIELPKHLR